MYVAAYALGPRGWTSGSREPGKPFCPLGRLIVVAGCAGWIASYIPVHPGRNPDPRGRRFAESAASAAALGFRNRMSPSSWRSSASPFPDHGIPHGHSGRRRLLGNVGQDGTPQYRFNGGGEYAGVLVLMVAGWAVARAFSPEDRQPYSDRERKLITFFWALVSLGSLLLSFGRFALFYQLVYALPYYR